MNPKILIIQLRRIGDVIFTLPVIGVLRKHFPQAQIDFLVEPPSDQMVGLHPGLSNTLVYDKNSPLDWLKTIRKKKYDWVLDFHSNGRTLFLTLASGAKLRAGFSGPITRSLVYTHLAKTSNDKYLPEQKLDILRSLGIDCKSWSWGLKIPKEESKWAEQFLKESAVRSEDQIVGLAPATRRPIRAWKEDRFAETAEKLASYSKKVIFLFGPGEKDLIERVKSQISKTSAKNIIVPPETSLLQLAALIQRCHTVLAVDNGPKNMAVALDVPTVTLSGPTNPLSFDPHGDPFHVIIRENTLHCISCGLNRCPYAHECMEGLTVSRVLESVTKLLTTLETRKAAI